MKIAYVSKLDYHRKAFIDRLKIEYDVEQFDDASDLEDVNEFDTIIVESIGGDAIKISNRKHSNIIIITRGVEVYESKLNRIKWDNVNWLLALSSHQIDYFKIKWGDTCKPKNLGVLPLIAPLDKFTLRKQIENNKVALIANITDRKGTYQIPEFLQRFPDLEIHHLGQVCLYGNPVREFVRWRLERDRNKDRYYWKKHIDYNQLNDWLEDKTYIWLPSISEGFCRAMMEGMTKGLKPIIRHFPGAENIWPKEYLYDRMEDIEKIIKLPYEPKEYREFVEVKYNKDKIFETFKKFL